MKFRILLGVIWFSVFIDAQTKSSFDEIFSLREKENKPVIILFSTDWCGVCKIQKRILKNLPETFWDKVYFISINPEKYYKDIDFLGIKYSYIANGTGGIHSLVYEVVGNKTPVYPFWIFLDKDNKMVIYEGLLRNEDLKELLK